MTESATVVGLPQLVDIALNTPEIGVVNFSVLHTLLHIIVKQLDEHCNVEFRGNDSDRLQNYITSTKPGPKITLSEYTVGTDGKKSKKRKKKRSSTAVDKEKGKVDEAQNEKESLSSHSLQTIVVVENTENVDADQQGTAKFTVALNKDYFTKIEEDVNVLREKIKELEELPGNMGLIEAIRTANQSDKPSPVLDMFQILNLTKRLDAAEQGMEKMASIVEDVAKVSAHATIEIYDHNREGEGRVSYGSINKRDLIGPLEKRVTDLENAVREGGISLAPIRDSTASTVRESLQPSQVEGVIPAPKTNQIPAEDLTNMAPQEAVSILQKDIENMKQICHNDFIQAVKDIEEIKKQLAGNASNLPADVRLATIETKFSECIEQINSLDTMYNTQVSSLTDRLNDIEKDLGVMMEKINMGLPAGDASGVGEQSIMELYNKITQLQEDMGAIMDTAAKLVEEKDSKQNNMEVMQEQIELLKTVKADKEDLEDALADKADACVINRKVSHDQFDAACDDLSKGIEEALAKLTQQETMWVQALDEIQKEVGSKLDRMELSPLRDFINNKLKGLQDKFKALTAMKSEQEAAGTKVKYLRNVNCISCDKDVVMRKEMDPSLYPKPYSLPPTRNMGPYLAYELDQLRKQQKCIPSTKNMNMFENALLSGRTPKDKDHVCNRYCGGSHTVTTPQQRVTRLGHFLEQWGPEITPVADTGVRGTDGQIYKGQESNILKQVEAQAIKQNATVQGNVPASKIIQATDSEADKRSSVLQSFSEAPSTEGAPSALRKSAAGEATSTEGAPSTVRKSATGEAAATDQLKEGAKKASTVPGDRERLESVKKSTSRVASASTVQKDVARKASQLSERRDSKIKASETNGAKQSLTKRGSSAAHVREGSKASMKGVKGGSGVKMASTSEEPASTQEQEVSRVGSIAPPQTPQTAEAPRGEDAAVEATPHEDEMVAETEPPTE